MLVGGRQALVFLHLPTIVVAASIGVWLFYVQHQFEDATGTGNEEWEGAHAASRALRTLCCPSRCAGLTANIGIHQSHHVASRIPFYRLPNVLGKRHPHLNEVCRLDAGGLGALHRPHAVGRSQPPPGVVPRGAPDKERGWPRAAPDPIDPIELKT